MRELDAGINKLTQRVIKAAIEVHRHLGPGFLESVYEEAMCSELELQSISFERQVPISINYKGKSLGDGRLDLVVDKKLIVELKAVANLAPIHTAQLLSYLKTTGHQLGLLINFNVPMLKEGIKRVVLT